MLKTARVDRTTSTHQLIKLWSARYLPDLQLLAENANQFPATTLVEAASPEGRVKTVQRAKRLLQLNCQMAGLETNALFAYIPNVLDLAEARRLAQYVTLVYDRMFDIYREQVPPKHFLRYIDFSSSLFYKLALPSLMMPVVDRLAEELEPLLMQLQQQHLSSKDSRTIGFITTQFHFSTREVIKQLTPCEQVLLGPYLKFVEEQVCIPWQRLCAAASRYPIHSQEFALVAQMLPLSGEIAQAVYQRSLQQCPDHSSRRGRLKDAGIAASTMRDLTMFQGYLWLCLLENSMDAIEQELLPLCIAVLPSLDVKWSLVEQMLSLLIAEIKSRLSLSQNNLLHLRLQAFQDLFAVTEMRSAANPARTVVALTDEWARATWKKDAVWSGRSSVRR